MPYKVEIVSALTGDLVILVFNDQFEKLVLYLLHGVITSEEYQEEVERLFVQ